MKSLYKFGILKKNVLLSGAAGKLLSAFVLTILLFK